MGLIFTWYGHAALGLETNGFRILVDPFFTGNPAATVLADQVAADFILVSHGHGDHIGDAVKIANRTKAVIVSNSDIAGALEKLGVKTHGQQPGGGNNYPFGYLKLTFALHSSRFENGAYAGIAAGFLLTTKENEKVYIAGDTGLFGDMRLIGEEGIDLAILPIGDNYTMGPADALRAVKLLQPRHVIPVHYNTWKIIEQNPDAWAASVQNETACQVHVLKPNDSFILPD
jgi:L-ascorbate metabolism protein UlaG (beta-lactamase superfamily)